MNFNTTKDFALQLDKEDSLANFREKFWIPILEDKKEAIYFCGNSLGLQPKTTKAYIEQELDDWKNLGVEGHFHAKNPWLYYHKLLTNQVAKLVGAKPIEVVVMNNLTVNLHLLMVSFYRPTQKRFKILMEGGAFPSDQYAAESQVRFHGFSPKEAIIEIEPRDGEQTLRTEDIIKKIEEVGDELALVMFGGVNYYTGQFFDLEKITVAAHKVGAKAGFDLAHAAGNVPLELHKWNVDFATWCSYKYLNSGAGGTSGVFIHEKYADDTSLPRFAGWWGHDEEARFKMEKGFVPMRGAEGWQLSNAQILPMAAHKASLDIFEEAGFENLRQKSEKLTTYMEFLIESFNTEQAKIKIDIITPKNKEDRGCQLSLVFDKEGKKYHEILTKKGVISDWREPNVIRIAPVPLYNSFMDCYRFYEILKEVAIF
ncbi:kynureninase [Bernardetia sp.]|uniref:kynureninase n=1 Tax=Bernardetia sp. TaxID=1937974 RepID=UPI0025C07CC6|nr:kynureninase [Bernardetia sp.]